MQDNNSTVEKAESQDNDMMTRRQALGAGAGAAVMLATAGTASASTETDTGSGVTLNFDSDYVHDPRVNGTVVVEGHQPDYGTLDYLADDETRANLAEFGFVLAERPDTEEVQAHNPVSLKASDIHSLDDDGNRVPHPEFGAFPRDTTYDDDGDSSTAEEDVSALDAVHWSTTDATNGTMSVSEGTNGSLAFDASGVADGETVTATFDLSTVGSSDATIGSPSRKFVQAVVDVDTLTSGSTLEIAAVDSTGASVAAKWVAGGDSSAVDVVGTSTGDAQVVQVRVGELEDQAGVTLEDVEQVEIRVLDAPAAGAVHGVNLERAETWTLGQQEQTTTEDGETVLETVDVLRPSGTFSVTDLSTFEGTVFSNAALASVSYDVEQRASELPEENVMARVKDAPDAYDREKVLEVFHLFESPAAYSLDISLSNMEDEVVFPSSRYTEAGAAASLSSEPEDWEDVDDVTWTDTRSKYDSVGAVRELLASVSSSDMAGYLNTYTVSSDEVELATGASSGAAVGAVGGGGGNKNGALTAILAVFGTLAVLGRNYIREFFALFGGN